MDRPLRVACLRGRTSDRTAGRRRGRRGAGARRSAGGSSATAVGRAARRATGARTCRPRGRVLEAAAAELEAAFAAGALPVLTASDCSICIATLPAVARHVPDVHVAVARRPRRLQHARDDPERLPRRHVPRRGVRALGRRLARHGRPRARHHARRARPRPGRAGARSRRRGSAGELAGRRRRSTSTSTSTCSTRPSSPASSRCRGGLSTQRLRAQLAELAARRRLVGVEVTALEDPALAPTAIAETIAPLLRAS